MKMLESCWKRCIANYPSGWRIIRPVRALVGNTLFKMEFLFYRIKFDMTLLFSYTESSSLILMDLRKPSLLPRALGRG
jgi:hypothetical protein